MNSLLQVDELVKEYLLVDKIIDELSNSIQTGDIQALIDYYRYLDIRFFSRLDSRFQPLPYLKNPANDPTFETFFSKHWVDNYTTSLHNFLAITIQNMHRVQKKSQQTEIEALKSIVENQKSTLEARENDIAKLKHEVIETRKEMTDGISLIRRRAASMTTTLKKSISTTTHELRPTSTGTNSINTADEEPFLVVGQEEFTEHASAITHAKFSVEGDLIASCDMDNIVRIWSYKGQSFNPLKINNTSSNILSLEWDARSDKFISSSPTEPVFVCAGSNNRMLSDTENSGALVAWSMKTMSSCLNHNGTLVVAGDSEGLMRVFGKSCISHKTYSCIHSIDS
ncbi:hypothetical protein BDB01DRAFT_728354 [Pilobolus umbonatus]|nr:hypothetical protein BDB01DRAFT_728354 [Pilobolus umbonatus]